jgi:Taurine catabolism dioxygenase TauD, TfdA family
MSDGDQPPTAIDAELRELLARSGWTVVPGVRDRAECERVLHRLGSLLPQYGGKLRHSVRFHPGFDDIQYSQSANAITPHTEAPGRNPPPRYIALHCHRQARCGGGQTMLADGYEFLRLLPEDLRDEAAKRTIRFDLAAGAEEDAIAAPLVSRRHGEVVLRYSYNVMRDGSLEGPARNGDDLDGIDFFEREFCRRGIEFSRRRGTLVLVPDHALLVIDNWRMLHSRPAYRDRNRHLTRYWVG